MKLQGYINEMKPDFHRLYGEKYQFDLGQSEVHIDLTLGAATKNIHTRFGALGETERNTSSGHSGKHGHARFTVL